MTTILALLVTSLAASEALDLPPTSYPNPFATAPAPGFELAAPAYEDPKPEDLNKWKGSVAVGGSIATGNTERKTATATANAERRSEKDRWSFGLLWNYADEDDAVDQRRTLVTGKYDYFLTKKLYLLANASGESDYNALLDLRLIFGVGAGYQFVEDEKWKVSGEAGLSYVDEDYKDNSADGEFVAARLAYKVECKVSEKLSAGQVGEIYPSLEDRDDVNARVDTHAKLTLTENMFAQAQWLYTWDNTPATGADRVDNLFLLALGWSF